MTTFARRDFLKTLGISSAALPLLANLPSLWGNPATNAKKHRLIIMFSPNGIVPTNFWSEQVGEHCCLKPILAPLEPFKDRLLLVKGMSNKVRGDGDGHMRGMSCLLTGIELFPGNIQGGSDTPAGWASGISIDQELSNYFQSHENSRTRFGSLEFGVSVPGRADPWTRMVYAGPNKPIAPVDNPYQMFHKLYGQMKDQESLGSILDDVKTDLRRVKRFVSTEDRHLLEEHETFVQEMDQSLRSVGAEKQLKQTIELEPGAPLDNDGMPQTSQMQIDLLVNSLVNDMARVATLQYTNSVGQARMSWLGIEENHHALSHDPDLNHESQEKLTKINTWFCEQLALLTKKLAETPEPDGDGMLLDHTTVVWTNELGKGNSHTLDNIPFVLVGGGFGFRMGRSVDFGETAHNRLWLSFAHGAGHHIETFGKPSLSEGGPLDLS